MHIKNDNIRNIVVVMSAIIKRVTCIKVIYHILLQLKVIGYTFKGSTSAIFILAFFSLRINSYRKEFAPVRANSLLRIDLF